MTRKINWKLNQMVKTYLLLDGRGWVSSLFNTILLRGFIFDKFWIVPVFHSRDNTFDLICKQKFIDFS